MRAIFCIATGSATYMQLALNLGLSVKANSSTETVLLYTNDAMADLGWSENLVDRRFGFAFDKKICISVSEENGTTPLEQAHFIKLSAYQIAMDMGYNEAIIIDADTIIIPSKRPEKWFDELNDVNFTAYCNCEFDFKTEKQSKDGYTFWCDPLEAMSAFKLKDKMPQINASFIYFKKSEEAKKVFDTAMDIWKMVDVSYFKIEKHNGSKTEEMCFNISCAINQIYPHKIPYQPIYFQYQEEENAPPYVAHYFNAISMAGNIQHTKDLCHYYTQLANYYKGLFGIKEPFEFSNETKKPKDTPINIPILKRRTIWRRGEIVNSDAGIFNPSGAVHENKLYTIFRKEKSMELYSHKYEHTTAIPHLCIDGSDGVELELVNMPALSRAEDFRIFCSKDSKWVSHTLVTNMTHDAIYSKMAISYIDNDEKLVFHSIPELPISTQITEKNWVFFFDGNTAWCVYSLVPYKIFYSINFSFWEELNVKQPKIRWWHHNRYVCNSTNPILVDGSYVMFFHSKDAGVYSHGACLIDKYTKEITHYTRNGISLPFCEEGMQKKLLYVSGAVYLEDKNIIRVYAGEGDFHSIHFDFNKDVLMDEIKKYKA